ncbi:tetratricopeptide repeat protein [Kitasatospora sp. A2-31]|uniref:tetratricopeptide repeat protein n=1 Tax=Kitasatospora sp. A2-31 TaxID=2916414 RepID=UPI001EEB48CE|nr:tetratricopeptide repeat protein [Kitasatospora sp. A2-31]MCG6496818.1 tetratricopeptide repeat protein [Kitasatospora sp. A2-31]
MNDRTGGGEASHEAAVSGAGGNGPGAGAGTPGGGDGVPEPDRAGEPAGDVYDWFRRGGRLLAQGHPAAAEQLLARAAAAEPHSRSIRETLARAQFDAGSYAAALENFRAVALADPSDDYAQFGWGVAAARLGDFETSAEHLALAVAMRPETDHYRAALRQTRATLAARAGAFGPLLPGAPGYLEPPGASGGPPGLPPSGGEDRGGTDPDADGADGRGPAPGTNE